LACGDIFRKGKLAATRQRMFGRATKSLLQQPFDRAIVRTRYLA
jgi:hypothetical protein